MSNCRSETYSANETLQITSLQVKKINKNKLFTRALYELFISFKLFCLAHRSGSELNIVTIPSILLMVPLIFFSKKRFFALDIRDAVWAYSTGKLYSKVICKVLARLLNSASKRANVISVTNIAECENVKDTLGRTPMIVPNGISEIKLKEMSVIGVTQAAKNIRMSYIGNVGIAQELDKFIDFTKLIPELHVKIIGDGAKLDTLKHKCEIENVKNVTFTGFVSPSMVSEYIKNTDILFAQIGLGFHTAVPTKVFEYIASGRKVLLGLPEGPAREIFSKFYGVEIFDVGVLESFLKSYEYLKALDYTESDRKRNISILRSKYLRENGARNYVDSIVDLCQLSKLKKVR